MSDTAHPSGSAPRLEDLLAHRNFVQSVARSIVGNDAEAEDVAQDVWLKAAEAPPKDGRSPKAWLFTVVRSVVRSRARGDSRRTNRERLAHEDVIPTEPREILAREEVRREVLDAVLSLDEPYRAAVLLRYLHELPIAEVAERTNVPTNTAAARIHRARATLRQRLEDRDTEVEIDLKRGLLLLAGPRIHTPIVALGTSLMLKPLVAVLLLAAIIASLTFLMSPPEKGVPEPPTNSSQTEAPPTDPSGRAESAGDQRSKTTRLERSGTPGGPEDNAKEEPGPRVTGRVVTPLGAPIEGAEITRLGAPGGPPPASVESDADGAFSLPIGVAGFAKVTATAEGYVTARSSVTEGDIGDVILRRGYRIVWNVVDDETGEPLPNAYASFRDGVGSPNRMIRADEDGTLVTTAPRIAAYLQIRADGYLPWSAEPLLATGDSSRVIRLPRESEPTPIRLRITHKKTGLPVPGVVIDGQAPTQVGGGVLEAGAYAAYANYYLLVEAPGFVPADLRIPIPEATSATPTHLKMVRATKLLLQVNDPDGHPAPGAKVVLHELERPPKLGPYRLLPTYTATTNERGAATIECLAPGVSYRAIASHADWNRNETQPIVVGDRPEQEVAPIRLAPRATLSGQVIDQKTRTPIVDADVKMVDSNLHVHTDSEGRFSYSPAPIGSSITATADGYVSRTLDETPDPRVPHDLTIALARGRSISGIVVSPDGQPIGGVDVKATRSRETHETTTRIDGSFELKGLSEGEPFELKAWDGAMSASIPDIHQPDRKIAAGETDIRLQLSAPSGLRIRVVRDQDGTPVRKFEIATIWRPDGERDPGRNHGGVKQNKADADGAAFIALEPGERVDITIRGTDLGEVSFADQTVRPGEIRDLIAKLSAPSIIEGHITLRDGRPAIGVVQLVRAGVENHWHFEAMTDDQGHFRIDGVSTGPYQIAFTRRVLGPDGAPHMQLAELTPAKVDVIPGRTFLELKAAEAPSNSVSGKVVVPTNARAADKIELRFGPNWEPRTKGVAEGLLVTLGPVKTFRFEGVDPGRYWLSVQADVDGSSYVLPGEPTSITIPGEGDIEIEIQVPGFPKNAPR